MARHRRGTAHENAEARGRVLSACLALIDQLGRMPGCHMIARRAGVSETDAANIRAVLLQEGDLPASMLVGDARFRQAVEDPTAEQPDDPNAAEIQARIAEVRAEKEAAARVANRFVMRARQHRTDRSGRRRYAM